MIKPPSASGYNFILSGLTGFRLCLCSTCAYDKHLLESSEVKSCSQEHFISFSMHMRIYNCFCAMNCASFMKELTAYKSYIVDCKYCTLFSCFWLSGCRVSSSLGCPLLADHKKTVREIRKADKPNKMVYSKLIVRES